MERHNLMEREIKASGDITDDQLKHYYLRNSSSAGESFSYHLAHILIAQNSKAGDDRSKKIHSEVAKAPENFATFVKQYSDDKSSLESGGDLGNFSVTSMAQEFRKVIPNTRKGTVTSPIKTKAGFHIIKVLDIQKGGFEELSPERKNELRNQMRMEEQEKKVSLWIERKKNDAHIKISAK
jgi:parvulin-like peptidyl-prolyl isomerase